MVYLEPIRANFEFGQINVVLMTLVIADCVPRKTPWPRGILLGIAIALKLTPAVFLLYFLLRRDTRALLVTASIGASSRPWSVSYSPGATPWEYWTETVHNTDRIGTATLNTNQNIAGALARLGLGEGARFVLWTVACFAVLGLTVWAARRVLRARRTRAGAHLRGDVRPGGFAGVVVAPLGVGAADGDRDCGVLAWRRGNVALGVVSAAGVALMVWTPIMLMPEHHETTASLWRQLVGGSYVWWALAVIVVAGTAGAGKADSDTRHISTDRVPATNQPASELGSELCGGLFTLLDVGGVEVDVLLA